MASSNNKTIAVKVATACLNCDAPLSGSYCSECGQSSSVERYKLGTVANELYGKLRAFELTSTLRTFKELLLRPGDFVTNYLSGKRVGYTNPTNYFFYTFVLDVLVGSLLHWLFTDAANSANTGTNLHMQIVTLIPTMTWGTLWWVLFRKSELNVVENIMSAIYFVAQVNMYVLVLQILSVPFVAKHSWASATLLLAEVLIYFIYSIFFCRKLFGDNYWKLIPKQLLLSILHFIFLLVAVFADTLGTQLLNTK